MEDSCRSTHQHQVPITSKPCSIATYLQKITRCVCVSCVCVRGETDVGAEGSEDKKKKALFAYYSCKFCDSLWKLGHMNVGKKRRKQNVCIQLCYYSCCCFDNISRNNINGGNQPVRRSKYTPPQEGTTSTPYGRERREAVKWETREPREGKNEEVKEEGW